LHLADAADGDDDAGVGCRGEAVQGVDVGDELEQLGL
jgi:hypothetical protein